MYFQIVESVAFPIVIGNHFFMKNRNIYSNTLTNNKIKSKLYSEESDEGSLNQFIGLFASSSNDDDVDKQEDNDVDNSDSENEIEKEICESYVDRINSINENSNKKSLVSITAAASTAASAAAVSVSADQLTYLQLLTAGAISRSIAQTFMHPANTYKTLLQLRDSSRIKLTPERLLRGVDAQFLLSLPHGAFYFFVIDQVKVHLSKMIPSQFNFVSDFASSTVSTIICSIVSTPQMVLTDRLMAGVYTSFPEAVNIILKSEGPLGFYTGWWPALAQKIPSYGLTWMFFQQFKSLHESALGKQPNTEGSFFLGAIAAAASVVVMIPMDTIKTRLVIQTAGCIKPYKGVADCFYRVLREEGVGTFYRSLPPRLMSVVPMIAIQFGVYEFLKKRFMQENLILARRNTASTLKKTALQGVKKVITVTKRESSILVNKI